MQPNTVDLVSRSGTLPKTDTYQLKVAGSGKYKLTLAVTEAVSPPPEPPPPPEPERTIQIR
ncbi:MAG: hypothetical protein SNJ60_05155 [Pseudanabaenaceae cyanobacterium]